MDVIRRNTDYALRIMVNLVENYGKGAISARKLAQNNDVYYELSCKLLQKLASTGFVQSRMGPSGGFELAKEPNQINLYDVIAAVQGQICINRCVLDPDSCPRSLTCAVSKKLSDLQEYTDNYLKNITLDELL